MSSFFRCLLTVSILVSMMISDGLLGQPTMTGRSCGLAGSSVGSMYGVHSCGWNPANLGLKANPSFSMTMLSMGMSFGNNAFSPKYLGDNFVEGDTLSQSQIDDILDRLESDNLKLYSTASIPAFGVSIGSYAFNIDAHSSVNSTIAADLIGLTLTGPIVDELYSLRDVEAEGMAYWTASLSAAKTLPTPEFLSELSAGASFKYIGGIGYAELVEHEGSLQITREKIHIDGLYKTLVSTSGDGVGLDIGVAGKLKNLDISCGLMLGNLIGSINWTGVEANEVQFYRDDGLDADSLTEADYWENFINQTDTTYSASSVKKPLPRYLLLGFEKPFLDNKIDLYLAYYQGINKSPGHSTTPKLAVGTELRYLPVLPFRFGIAFGGKEHSQFAAGFGFKFQGYQFNIGASWQRGFASRAQGLSFAVTNYFGAAAD